MTLYWWMHWFWITTLNPFLVIFLFGGSVVQSLSLPFVPVVQNGHQNGPYVTKSPSDTTSKIFHLKLKDRNNYHTASYQEIAQYSPDDLSTTNENLFKHSLTADELETPTPLSDENVPDGTSTAPTNDKPAFQTKTYLQFPSKTSPPNYPTENITQGEKTFQLPETNDNDDTIGSFLLRSVPVHDEPIVSNTQGNSTHTYQGIEDGNKEATQIKAMPDQPMSDGPFNPTGSFINSTNIHLKSSTKQNTTVVKLTTSKSDLVLTSGKPVIGHRSKTVNREKTIQERNQTATVLRNEMGPILYVTPSSRNDSMESRPELNEGSNISSINSDWNNVTSVLSDDSAIVQNVKHWHNRTGTGIVKSLASITDKVDVPRGVIPVSKERVGEAVEQNSLNAASVTGIALGILSSAGLIGGISFMLYRRRYLNKPQTLNDSNPDSIGYLDDSTLRENSEEMYSLDNDSFLNSLEAMTIQNYWTDSVKHTKL